MNILRFANLISTITSIQGREMTVQEIETIYDQVLNLEPKADKVSVTAMFQAMIDGSKIEAIKEHRALTGMMLKESKEEIETIMFRMVGPKDMI